MSISLPADIRARAEAHVQLFCQNQVSDELRDQLRVGHRLIGNKLTLLECRPPWNPAMGTDWTSIEVAQLRFEQSSGEWTLYWKRATGRWERYDGPLPSKDVGPLLAEIADDPDGCFWG